MLTITTDAADAIRAIVSSPELPETAGVRIAPATQSADTGGAALVLELASAPGAEDEVIDEEGAQVFLDPATADALSDKLLDAEIDSGGQFRFAVVERR